MARSLDLFEKIGDVLSLFRVAIPLGAIALGLPFLSMPFGMKMGVVWILIPVLDATGSAVRNGFFAFVVPTEQEVFRMMRLSIPFVAHVFGLLLASSIRMAGKSGLLENGSDLLPPI
ncbi:MAG: hypothetical protein WBA02_01380 [Jannaschia helgolandensis]|nr:hypothetical protein [Jannaschia helgolandensis]